MDTEKQKLDSLIAELNSIEARLAEVPELENRRKALEGSVWSRDSGEIPKAKIAYTDSLHPIFEERIGYGKPKRIVKVDTKWVSIKNDGLSDSHITRYKVSNGWPERSRDDHGAINVKKALNIWAEHVGFQSVAIQEQSK